MKGEQSLSSAESLELEVSCNPVLNFDHNSCCNRRKPIIITDSMLDINTNSLMLNGKKKLLWPHHA